MPTLDLRPEWLDLLRRLLAEHLPGAEVMAYGSRVTGTAHEGSDLDLVVRNPDDPGRPFPDLWRLREALSESDLPILVDVLDWGAHSRKLPSGDLPRGGGYYTGGIGGGALGA